MSNMFYYETIINAINPETGELTKFFGPNIPAISPKLAYEYCQNNGLGYCKIGDRIVMTIEKNTDKKEDFETIKFN